MDIGVETLREATEEAVECFDRLLPQLSSSAPPVTRASLQEIIACPTNTVLAARTDRLYERVGFVRRDTHVYRHTVTT